jgi:thioredoxin reductase
MQTPLAPSDTLNRADRYCIIGAGSSGLTAAKNLKQLGIPFDIFEREDGIGGNWYYGKPHSSVCRSTHLISSKPLTKYRDFPMPADYPPYPSHEQVLAYFQSYARHFDLEREIAFSTEVTRVAPVGADARLWDVTITRPDGASETRRYRGVVICNGHNWDPKYPDYPGAFSGQVLHSCRYKTPDVLEGKRVLVIAAEAASHAHATFLSTRRGYYYMPTFFCTSAKPSAASVVAAPPSALPFRASIRSRTICPEIGRCSSSSARGRASPRCKRTRTRSARKTPRFSS